METDRDLFKNAAPIMIALVVTTGFFYFIYLLYSSNEIPKENSAQLNILLGGIAAVWAKAVGFFYDSSASSKDKDATISAIAKTIPAPIAPPPTVAPTVPPAPIVIQNAENVNNKTQEGDINVTPKEPTS